MTQRKREQTGGAETGLVHRRRVGHDALQRSTGEALHNDGQAETGAVSGNRALLVEFVRCLLGEVSGDAVYLALYAAVAKTGSTKEEGEALLKVLQREQRENSIWPEGFL